MNDPISSLKDQVRPYLRRFLEENGVKIDSRGFLRCLHPDHEDRNPSMHLVPPKEEHAWCFSGQHYVDIFVANHYLTGAPLTGTGFITGNLYPLLDRYGIKHDDIQFSEEAVFKEQLTVVYDAACTILVDPDEDCTSFELAGKRGWDQNTCRKLGIGTVLDYDQFVKKVSARTGISEDLVKSQYGIWPKLFGQGKITFAVHRLDGRVSHFIVRNLKGSPKYDTSPTNYRVEPDVLYGLHIAKRFPGKRLDIFEGPSSVATAVQNEHLNCCALCGLNFTASHAEMIKQAGVTSVCFVLDQDAAGRAKMKRILESGPTIPGLEFSVLHLPLDEKEAADPKTNDPDYYIRTYGLTAYSQVEPVTAFDYKLDEYINAQPQPTKTAFLKSMIPVLLSTENRVERGIMIKRLAEVTSIDPQDIRDEIERVEKADVRHLVTKFSKELVSARSLEDVTGIVAELQVKLESTTIGQELRRQLSVHECMVNFNQIMETIKSRDTGIHGWKTGFKYFDEYVDGIPKPLNGGSLLAIAGKPHVGKSAFLLALAYNVARLNKDVTVLYWAIDDARKDIYLRLLAATTGIPMTKVGRIVPFSTEAEESLLASAEQELAHLIESGKFQVKDDDIGRQRIIAEKWIDEVQETYSRPVLLVIDSFHNVVLGGKAENDERIKAKMLSIWLKSDSRKRNFTVLCTMELNKAGFERPSLASINETGKIVYDWDFIAFVHNQFLDYRTAEAPHWVKNGVMMPMIELDIQKSKLGRRGSLWYQLDEETTAIAEVDPNQIDTSARQRAREMEREYNKSLGRDRNDMFS